MDKTNTARRRARRPAARKWIQLYSALLHNAHLKGFLDGEIYEGAAKYACVPGLNCYSCPGAVGACPLGALQNALASAGHRTGWYVLGTLLLFGTILGRTVCGWLCPLGLIQELLNRIPTFKIRKSRATRLLTGLKYILLAVFVVAVPLWYGLKHGLPLPAFCKYICPAGTLEGAACLLSHPDNSGLFAMLGPVFTGKFVVLLLIGLACIFCYRSFCRFLCPLGALYGLFNRFCLVGVTVDADRCSGCGTCVRRCGMDVKRVGDRECIHCAECMAVCSQKAISLKAGGITLKAPEGGAPGEPAQAAEKRRTAARVIRGAALAVLCFALIWFNVLDPALKTAPDPSDIPAAEESAVPIGAGVGMRLPDFTIPCLDGTEFRLADTRGRVTFINLWATYCAPCVRELPYFSALCREHRDDIAVLAVHSSLVTDDPAAFLADRDWDMSFAVDTNDTIWRIADGSAALPQTVVLDRSGTVICNRKGSVTPEMLAALYEQAARGSAADPPAPAPAAEAERYRILVTDESGTPVPGVMVQFCSDTECRMERTDESGTAYFDPGTGPCTVHVLRVPAGFVPDDTEYAVPETPASMTIVLRAEDAE